MSYWQRLPFRSAALLAVTVLTTGSTAVASRWRNVPQPGALLFATPQLRGSVFERSVIILIDHDESGSLGLIINKPTEVAVADALDIEGAERLHHPLYLGGPVAVDGLAGLLRTDDPPDGSRHVVDDVFFVVDRESFTRAFRSKAAAQNVQVYIGYSGWGSGQLQHEIDRGSWVITQGSAAKVFLDDPTALWEEVYRLLERIEVRSDDGAREAKYSPA